MNPIVELKSVSKSYQTDRIEHNYSHAANRIDIEFETPAQEGHRLSPTCSVQNIKRSKPAKTETYLSVVCSKDSRED